MKGSHLHTRKTNEAAEPGGTDRFGEVRSCLAKDHPATP